MPLTEIAIRSAKPRAGSYSITDARGLSLEIAPSGGKWWRFKYRFDGKQKRMSLGVYPDISLKDARDRRDEVRKLVANGVDPLAHRKEKKVARQFTFEIVTREWFEKNRQKWAPRTWDLVTTRIQKDLIPEIGHRPINVITPRELLGVLERVQARGALETAHRLRQDASLIFRFAVAKGYVERDPAADVRGALHERTTTHHAAVTSEVQLGALMRAIDDYEGDVAVRAAIRVAPRVFVRPGELRAAAWTEIDLEAAEWRIPAARMKMRQEHIVPLSTQVVIILRELHEVTGRSAYVFPSVRSRLRPLSENTLNAALRRMGYTKDQATAHGFRTTATTRLNESGLWHRDAIERQLAHAESNKVRASYNKAEHLPERRRMMQWWSDYLDALRDGVKAVSAAAEEQPA